MTTDDPWLQNQKEAEAIMKQHEATMIGAALGRPPTLTSNADHGCIGRDQTLPPRDRRFHAVIAGTVAREPRGPQFPLHRSAPITLRLPRRWAAATYVALAVCLLSIPSAHASLLIDPSGGTVVFSDATNHDDETVSRALPGGSFSFSFFGTPLTTLSVSSNGDLNFSGNISYSNSAFPNSFGLIAPLWDDLEIFSGSGESISEKSDSASYSVTWDIGQFGVSTTRHEFQATLFGAPAVIGTTAFLAGDIAFSYQTIGSTFAGDSASVGLNKGDSVNFTPLPGTANGLINHSQAGSLPTAAGSYLLMRPADANTYNATVGNTGVAVPEPSTWALVSIGGSALLWRLARKRTRSNPLLHSIAFTAITSLLLVMSPLSSQSQTVLDTTARGWYDSMGFHGSTNDNYVTGHATNTFWRDFFLFDLSAVTTPITSADLLLFNPSSGYSSNNSSESLQLYEVTTSASPLTADESGQTAIYTDLGDGLFYGSTTVTSSVNGTTLDIALNPNFLAKANAARGGTIALGGLLTPLASDTSTSQYLFGFSGTSNPADGSTRLAINTVPEPSTWLLMGVGVVLLLWLRRAQRNLRNS